MPLYNFRCSNKECRAYNQPFEHYIFHPSEVISCEHCKQPLIRLFPINVHITGIGKTKDGMDRGKVTKEKNENLKEKWSGYSYEKQNIREKVTKMANEKIQKDNLKP